MADEQLQHALRQGSPDDILLWRLRTGSLSTEHLLLASSLGHPTSLVSTTLVDWTQWDQRRDFFFRFQSLLGHHALVAICCDFVEHVPRLSETATNCLLLVRQWLKDPSSVSKKQLQDGANAAYAVYAAYAAYAAVHAAYAAAAYAAYAAGAGAAVANTEREWQKKHLIERLLC